MRSQRLGKEKINFKLKHNEVGKYPTDGITLDDVREGYLKKFTPEQIEKAKQLKAKQLALYEAGELKSEPKFSDEYYLDYVESMVHTSNIARVREMAQNRLLNYAITDIEWAQYSYEEILQMEQNGYKIPQEVLEWAHSQQQADVTDYIVLMDSVETDDLSDTTDVTASDELSKYRAQSLKDIARIEKAEKETQENIQQYNETQEKAKSIQQSKMFGYKKELKKAEEMTEEWKKLNDKKEAGTLNIFEQNRYEKLSEELKGSSSGFLARIKAENFELDDFLSKLDVLDKKIEKNNEIVIEATQNATDLTNIERQYAPSQLPVATKGVIFDGKGPTLDTLYNINIEDISRIAIQKSTDLNELDTSTLEDIQSEAVQNLVGFAVDYTKESGDVINKTEGVTGSTQEGDSQKSQEGKPQEEKDNYNVARVFSAANAAVATGMTIAATQDMISAQKSSQKKEKELIKQVNQAEKDIQNLDKEVNAVDSEHQNNLSEEESFLMQLEELNAQEQSQEVPEENPEQAPEKEALNDQINSLRKEDSKLTAKVVAASGKSSASIQKSKNFASILRNETRTFEQIRKTAEKVSTDTAVVGAGTTFLGQANTMVGTALVETGAVMASSIIPATVIAGLKMVSAGVSLAQIGALEIITGAVATETGIVGAGLASTAKSVTSSNETTDKNSQVDIKEDEAAVKGIVNGLDIEVSAQDIQEGSAPTQAISDEETLSAESSDAVKPAFGEVQVSQQSQSAVRPISSEVRSEGVSSSVETQKSGNIQSLSPNTSGNIDNAKTPNGEVDSETVAQEPKARGAYDVEKDFSISGAVNATKTTIKASDDVLSSRSEARSKEASYDAKILEINKINQQIDANRQLALSITAQQQQRAAQVSAQIGIQDAIIRKAQEEGNPEELDAAQNNIQILTDNFDSEVTDSEKMFTSNITEMDGIVNRVQTDRINLKSELVDFNKKIDEQLDASQKTLVVGAGTSGVGFARGFAGSLLAQSGYGLVTSAGLNIAQQIIGTAMMVQGTKMLLEGGIEEKTGILASSAGAAGLVVHSQVKDDKADVENSEKSSVTFLNMTRGVQRQNRAAVEEIRAENTTSVEEVNLIAASATANANSVDRTETDDKAEKKLARFNKETEIESRKKRKKVIAVSSSSRG